MRVQPFILMTLFSCTHTYRTCVLFSHTRHNISSEVDQGEKEARLERGHSKIWIHHHCSVRSSTMLDPGFHFGRCFLKVVLEGERPT